MSDSPTHGGRPAAGRVLAVLLPVVCLTVLAAACEDDEIGSPLSIELIGPGTGVAGEELSVLYEVRGRSLRGIVFEWGDGAADSLPTAGAQSAAGAMDHTYLVAGRFTVRALAEDAVEGVAVAEVSIDVAGS